jgi:predicted transcriptional regulator of viral defense system
MPQLSGIGKKSRSDLALVLRLGRAAVSVGDAAIALSAPRTEVAKKLARWAAQGWLSRVRRGLYVPVALEAKSSDVIPEDAWIIADRLYSPCYIGGWSAAEYWGLTEQLFRSVIVRTTKQVRDREVSLKGLTFRICTTSKEKFFGLKPIWRGTVQVNVSDPTRTIVDLMDDPSLGGGLRPAVDVFSAYMRGDNKNVELLLSYGDQLGNRAMFKRLGFLAEKFFLAEERLIAECKKRISKGNSALDPGLRATKLATRWRLWLPKNW